MGPQTILILIMSDLMKWFPFMIEAISGICLWSLFMEIRLMTLNALSVKVLTVLNRSALERFPPGLQWFSKAHQSPYSLQILSLASTIPDTTFFDRTESGFPTWKRAPCNSISVITTGVQQPRISGETVRSMGFLGQRSSVSVPGSSHVPRLVFCAGLPHYLS